MPRPEFHARRLYVVAFRGNEAQAGSFPIHSMDRDYIRACTKAFLFEFRKAHGSPEKVRMWIG